MNLDNIGRFLVSNDLLEDKAVNVLDGMEILRKDCLPSMTMFFARHPTFRFAPAVTATPPIYRGTVDLVTKAIVWTEVV